MSDELLNEFIFDAREHLSTAGAQLLELEKQCDSLPVLNALMGTLHTIKGTSGFFDLQHIYGLLNNAESLLQTVREKEGGCSPKVIELLLQVLDTVEAILDRLENGLDDRVEWIEALTEALGSAEKILENGGLAVAAASSMAAPPSLENCGSPDEASLLVLSDGQLGLDPGGFALEVENRLKAGASGPAVDLRGLSSVNGAELKALMTAARKFPAMAFILDQNEQQSLARIFKLLSLDDFMRFFSDEKEALEYVKS